VVLAPETLIWSSGRVPLARRMLVLDLLVWHLAAVQQKHGYPRARAVLSVPPAVWRLATHHSILKFSDSGRIWFIFCVLIDDDDSCRRRP